MRMIWYEPEAIYANVTCQIIMLRFIGIVWRQFNRYERLNKRATKFIGENYGLVSIKSSTDYRFSFYYRNTSCKKKSFGYTGATYVNRIENLEKKITKYVNETDALTDKIVSLDKQVVAVDEQIKSLNIETQDLSPIKTDIIALQTSIAGINVSVDLMYVDLQSLKNINDNPLAN